MFLGVKRKSSKKSPNIHSQRKSSQEGRWLQIWVGYLDSGALQKINKLQLLTRGLHRRIQNLYLLALIKMDSFFL